MTKPIVAFRTFAKAPKNREFILYGGNIAVRRNIKYTYEVNVPWEKMRDFLMSTVM
jgi:hypothetical protein